MNWRLNKSIRFYKISNTCEEGGAHLRVSFWHLLTNLKNNYLLKTMLKWANKCKHFHICNVAFKKKKKKNTWKYPLKTQQIKILKKWKHWLKISSFYTCVPKTAIIWCMAPEIWSKTDIIFCHFGPFLPFNPSNDLENQKFWKNEKSTCICHHFTHLHQKSWSWCMLPEIRSATERICYHIGPIFALLSH